MPLSFHSRNDITVYNFSLRMMEIAVSLHITGAFPFYDAPPSPADSRSRHDDDGGEETSEEAAIVSRSNSNEV